MAGYMVHIFQISNDMINQAKDIIRKLLVWNHDQNSSVIHDPSFS